MADSLVPSKTALQTLPELPALPDAFHVIKALPADKLDQLLDAIIAHYENGASIYRIAEQLGVNNATLYRGLKKHRLEQWREVVSARYEAEIEDAEKDLKEASDVSAVTRARERLASARWRLERIDRRNYGQDNAGSSAQAVQININLRRDLATNAVQHEVIDVESKSEQ